jgi:hypothetical protein
MISGMAIMAAAENTKSQAREPKRLHGKGVSALAIAFDALEERCEGRIERPFSKQGAEQIGKRWATKKRRRQSQCRA